MKAYAFDAFGLENLRLLEVPDPAPAADQVVVDVRAFSLNYRDLLVLRGLYNPMLKLPATPVSDGAGVVSAVGESVRAALRVGDRVVSHFVSGWLDGPFRADYTRTALGAPGPGLAAERVALPATAVLPIPEGLDFEQAATLPIAALTAWSALVTEGQVAAGQTVLTLGTGGVSVFALQFAKALGARVIITSSSDEKLARARALGADDCINYRTTPDWAARALELTGGGGVDLTVETVGAGTLDDSLRATRAGGVVALLGALAGMKAEINAGQILMKRLRVAGIMVDSRSAFEALNRFIVERRIEPVIDRVFGFAQLPAALEHMQAGRHFGKIVVEGPGA